MKNKRNYSKSQLKWLAENLSTSQMNYLIESNEQTIPTMDATNGDFTNPDGYNSVTQTSQGQDSKNIQDARRTNQQNPNQKSHQSPTDDKAKISTVCKAIKNGKLNKIEPAQLNKFLSNAGISTKNVASAIKYAIEFLHSQMQNPQNISMSTLKNTTAGINNCLGALTQSKLMVAESMFRYLKNNGINVNNLASDIRNNNFQNVFKAGKVASMVNESVDTLNISEKVEEYYKLIAQIKKLTRLAESCNIKKHSNVMKLTKEVDDKMNESVSAIKFSVKFYNKNKKG